MALIGYRTELPDGTITAVPAGDMPCGDQAKKAGATAGVQVKLSRPVPNSRGPAALMTPRRAVACAKNARMLG